MTNVCNLAGQDAAGAPAPLERYLTLQTGLDMLEQGLSIFDADLRLVAWNRAYVKLLEFPEEMAWLGAPFRSFIEYNARRGDYGPGDPEQQVAERIAAARQHRAARSREHIAGPGGSEPGASWPCSNDASVGCRDNSVRALVYKDGTAPACGRTRLLDLASFQARKGARKLTGMRCQDRRRISKPWQC